ncbi:hypothetical protein FI667_g9554, partial [Globisporangium splendens]
MDRGGDEIADGSAAGYRGEEADAFLNLGEDGPTPDQLFHYSPTVTSADPSFDEVLAHAVPEVSALIPAERVILFVYDKNTHSLVPRFVSSVPVEHHDGKKHPEAPPSTESVGFPPVMGLVSTCFLHKRCLRMQEPHPHRAFHREYDAPKDMVVDSILCAPIVLHHRVIGVIELLNRMDLEDDAPHASFEALTRLDDHQDAGDVSWETGTACAQLRRRAREIPRADPKDPLGDPHPASRQGLLCTAPRASAEICSPSAVTRVQKAQVPHYIGNTYRAEKKARAAMSSPAASVSLPVHVKPRLPRRELVVLQDAERFRAKVAAESATSKDAYAPIKDADCVNSSHRVAIIKLQSFVRGSLVRKRIKEMVAIHRAMRLPTVMCLRIASTSSSGESCNQLGEAVEPQHYMHRGDRCVYAMPGRIHTAAHLVQRRSCATRGRLEELYDHARNSVMAAPSTRLAWKRCGDATRRLAKGKQDGQADSFLVPPDDASGNNALFVDTRRLAPTRDKSNDSAPRPAAPFSNSNILNMPHWLSKVFPAFAFAPTRKSRTTPGAVEFATAMRSDDDQPHTSNQNPSVDQPSQTCRNATACRQQALYAALQMASPGRAALLLVAGVHAQQTACAAQRAVTRAADYHDGVHSVASSTRPRAERLASAAYYAHGNAHAGKRTSV